MQLETAEVIKPARLIWWAPVHYDLAAQKHLESLGHTPTPQILNNVSSIMRDALAEEVKAAHDKALQIDSIDSEEYLPLPRYDYMKGETFGSTQSEPGSFPWAGRVLYELALAAKGTNDQNFSTDGSRYTFLDYDVDSTLAPHCYDVVEGSSRASSHRWRVAIIDSVHEKDDNHSTPYQTATLSLVDINSVKFVEGI